MDLAYSKDHIDTFVIVSGDSDFSPLVSKLKEIMDSQKHDGTEDQDGVTLNLLIGFANELTWPTVGAWVNWRGGGGGALGHRGDPRGQLTSRHRVQDLRLLRVQGRRLRGGRLAGLRLAGRGFRLLCAGRW